MSTDDKIAMLQALLARVKSRSRDSLPAAPTHGQVGLPAAPANGSISASSNGKTHASDEVVAPPVRDRAPSRPDSAPPSPLDAPTPMAAFRPSPVPPPPSAPERRSLPPSAPKFRPEAPPLFAAKPVAPPTRAPSDASLDQTLTEATTPLRRIPPRPEPSGVRAVEPPPMEVIELDVDPDPSIPPPSASPISAASLGEEGLESRSRLVSAPPVALESGTAETDDLLDDAEDDEDEEPFPLSVPPGHAASDPTIEAAPADVSQAEMDAIDAADRAPTSSRRPITMEEKMGELEEDSIPLHTPPPASGKLLAASPTIELAPHSEPIPVAAPPAIAALPSLTREALRAESSPPSEVALFVGRTPSDVPVKTFGDLLDATLAL